MDRNELRELRAEFKELSRQPEQPWAIFDERGTWGEADYRREWGLRQAKAFEPLAKRLAMLAGLSGADAWLDRLAEAGGIEIKWHSPDHAHGTFSDLARRSVEAIDELLAQPTPPPTPESEPPANGNARDTMAQMLDRLSMAIGADSNTIIQIVNSDKRAEDKARAICEVDATHWAHKSPYWAKLLGVSESAIKKTTFWRVERPRHFADATALWKSENPDTELPKELRQWDDNGRD